MTKKNTPKKRIPKFASIEEEAVFWETHSTADYEDEFKPAQVRFAKNLSQGVTIRLDAETLEKIRVEAHEKGPHDANPHVGHGTHQPSRHRIKPRGAVEIVTPTGKNSYLMML